jgi:hypothetical protein
MDEAQRQAMFDELAQHLRNGDVDYEDFLLERLQRGLPYVDRRHWEAQVRGQEEKGAPAVAPAPKAKRSWWCCGS